MEKEVRFMFTRTQKAMENGLQFSRSQASCGPSVSVGVAATVGRDRGRRLLLDRYVKADSNRRAEAAHA